MDTYTQPVTTKRQYRSLEEKQQIVGEALAEEALAEGESVARVARSQRQPGLQLVQAVSGGATETAERCQTVAGASPMREFHSAASFMWGTKWLTRLLGGHDSHPTRACASAGRKRCQSGVVACVVGVSPAMIALPSHTKIWIAAGVTDLRRGSPDSVRWCKPSWKRARCQAKCSSSEAAEAI